MKVFEFEVYTKCKETGKTGYAIAFPLIVAVNLESALKKLKSLPYFDVVILHNWTKKYSHWLEYRVQYTGMAALHKKAINLLTDLEI